MKWSQVDWAGEARVSIVMWIIEVKFDFSRCGNCYLHRYSFCIVCCTTEQYLYTLSMKCCQANVYVVFACSFRKGGGRLAVVATRRSPTLPPAPCTSPPARRARGACTRTSHEEYPHSPLRFQYSIPNCIQLQHFWTNRNRVKCRCIWTKILKGFQYFVFAFSRI